MTMIIYKQKVELKKKRNGDMGRVSICQKNCNTIDLRRAQVNELFLLHSLLLTRYCLLSTPAAILD